MIVVNLWLESGTDPYLDGYHLDIAGVINDSFSLTHDVQLAFDAIDNDGEFTPKEETLYEIHLLRGTISSDPVPEPCFVIAHVYEKVKDHNDQLITPLIRL